MDNPNITMEEYIRLKEEKARQRGKVYNWETAKYGKIWYDEDVHDLRSVETEFPAIVVYESLSEKPLFMNTYLPGGQPGECFQFLIEWSSEFYTGIPNPMDTAYWIPEDIQYQKRAYLCVKDTAYDFLYSL
ncbi:hypothetical protein Tco_1195096 [Tanacetum coccineum]